MATLAPELAVTSPTHRYLIDIKAGFERLYDRDRDPEELRDLTEDAPALVRRFRVRVAEWQREEARRITCLLEGNE